VCITYVFIASKETLNQSITPLGLKVSLSPERNCKFPPRKCPETVRLEEARISNSRAEILLIYFMDIKDLIQMMLSPEQSFKLSVFTDLKVYDSPLM
jgi:hypothetical protein